MADQEQDDELLKDLMSSIDEGQPAKTAASTKNAETKSGETNLDETQKKGLAKYLDKEKILELIKKLRVRLEGSWQLPFMLLSIMGALYIWVYLPNSLKDEDIIQSPQWWFNKGLHYFKIAEDKGLDNNFSVGDFSRFEFKDISFENKKEIFEAMKAIKSFESKPDLKNENHFINTFVNDLNKLLLDMFLIENFSKEQLAQADESVVKALLEEISNSKNSNVSDYKSSNKNHVKLLNRKLLEGLYENLPKFKPSKLIAARYFQYVFDKFPNVYEDNSVMDLLNAADTFYFVVGDSMPRKDRLMAYELVYKKNDPLFESAEKSFYGGEGMAQFKNRKVVNDSLPPEDQAHLEFQLASLHYSMNDNFNAQKFFKRFLELSIEKSSEGYERRLEKNIGLKSSSYNVALHREITPSKINKAYYILGLLQFQKKNYDDSQANLDKFTRGVLAAEPEQNFNALEMLGDIFLENKNYDKALSYYRKALGVQLITSNQKAPVKYKAGFANYKLMNFPKAIERFKQVKGTGQYGRYNAAALYYRGKSRLKLGEEDNAVELFKRVRERYPDSLEDLASTFEVSKYFFRKKMYENSFNEPIGIVGEKGDKNDFSIKKLLEKPIEKFLNNEFLNPDEILSQPDSDSSEIGLLYDLANVFTSNQQYEKAIEVYTLMTSNPLTVHQMGKKRDLLYFDMAKIWYENGMPIRAGETLEIMLERIPDTPYHSRALWDICKYYMEKDDYGRAIKPLRKFTSSYIDRPETPESLYLLGLCEQKVGEFEKAIESYNRAYGYSPWKPKKVEIDGKFVVDPSDEDPYYVLGRNELPIERNFYAYQAIEQKGLALAEAGLYDEAIDQIYKTVFNDPLFRFQPASEVWKNSLLNYANAWFQKGWKALDIKNRVQFYENAEVSYLDYLDRYEFVPVLGLSPEFDKEQLSKWEKEDTIKFDITFKLANMAYDLKQYDKARDLLGKVMRWDVKNWLNSEKEDEIKDAHILVPMTLFHQQKWEDAISSFRDAKDRYSTSIEAPLLGMKIAECYQKLGKLEEARNEFQTSEWILDSVNKKLFENRPGETDKKFWNDLIKYKKGNQEWASNKKNNE